MAKWKVKALLSRSMAVSLSSGAWKPICALAMDTKLIKKVST